MTATHFTMIQDRGTVIFCARTCIQTHFMCRLKSSLKGGNGPVNVRAIPNLSNRNHIDKCIE